MEDELNLMSPCVGIINKAPCSVQWHFLCFGCIFLQAVALQKMLIFGWIQNIGTGRQAPCSQEQEEWEGRGQASSSAPRPPCGQGKVGRWCSISLEHLCEGGKCRQPDGERWGRDGNRAGLGVFIVVRRQPRAGWHWESVTGREMFAPRGAAEHAGPAVCLSTLGNRTYLALERGQAGY